MSETHRDYFNRLAAEWNERMPTSPEFRDYLKDFGVQEGDRILDIGAGTGRMTRFLAEFVGTEGFVVAQDIAEKMMVEAKTRTASEQAAFVCDDIMAMSCKNDVFDKLLCFSAFPHFEDKHRAVSEMARVLKTGGRLLILHNRNSAAMNTFHASLPHPVHHDRLPDIPSLEKIFRYNGLIPIRMEESQTLYWAEAMKA